MKKSAIAISIILASITTTVKAETEVTIAGWGGNDVVVLNNLVTNVLADEFKAADLSIKYQAVEGDFSQFIMNSLSAGTAPDAFYVDIVFANTLINSGKLKPNSEDLNLVAQSLLPNLNAAFTKQEVQYGLAKDFNALAIVFNKDIFDEAKVEYPSDADNWDTLRDKLIEVQANLNGDVHGLCVMPDFARFAVFPLSTGWKPFDENGKTILDENFKRAFEFYTGLVTKDKVGILAADIGQDWGGGCFGTEETAITFEGNWISGYLRDKAPNLPYGSALTPKDPISDERGNLLFTVAWGINSDGKNVAATQKAIEILTSPKAQEWVLESGLALPSRIELGASEFFSIQDKENLLSKTIFTAASSGHVQPFSFKEHGSAWMEPINEALSAVMLGQMSVDDALIKAQKLYDDMNKS